MSRLREKIENYKKKALAIESNIEAQAIEKSEILLEQYSKEIQNSLKYCFRAILNFQSGNVSEAINELVEGTRQHPFNYNIYYNLGFMYGSNDEYELALEAFFHALKYSASEDERRQAISEIQIIINKNKENGKQVHSSLQKRIDEFHLLLKQTDGRAYPLDVNRNSMIRKIQFEKSKEEFMLNMYQSLNMNDVDSASRMFFKTELIKGEGSNGKRIINSIGPVVIPISQIDSSSKITFKINGEKLKFVKYPFTQNQFHYIRIEEPGKIEIKSDSKIFIGSPIEMKPIKKPIKLSLNIFIDGLSYQFLEDNGLEKVMPNTYRFFKGGVISSNCYTTSEWTLPSKASINTGLYSTEHMMLHPDHLYIFKDSQKLLSEYFQSGGYYCTSIGGNWRTTPTLGYHRGYNRMIYQNYMDSKEVIMETIEHLMSFEDANNFIDISLMDLHNVADGFESHLYSQVNTNITDRINKNNKGSTSVQTKYDISKIAKYYQEIRRLDGILSILYDFLEKTYSEEDFVITMHSDHGQSFLEEDFNLLSDNRLKVPFMMRGRNVPAEESKELIETVDFLPTILECCELEQPTVINGKLPKVFGGERERNYTFSQVIHPNQPYKALINDKYLSYYLEAQHPVLKDLSICLEGYKSYILDKKSGLDVTEQNLEKLNQYDEVVFNNIKNMLRWSN